MENNNSFTKIDEKIKNEQKELKDVTNGLSDNLSSAQTS